MAPKKKATGRPFKKGKSGNPKGSSDRAKSRQLKQLAKLTAEEVADVGTLILGNNRKALKDLAEDKKSSVLKVWMAGLIVQSMKKGDATIFRAVLDRVVGKSLERTELTGRDGGALALEVAGRTMTEDEMRLRADKLATLRQAVGDD
ncbi:MAG: hypothetical protein EOO38_01650 [Cytophagaceae bacterium]|nr:MAG: hypothetical protein EOO38_01650 [Cytophagaceae bacterium]